MKIKFVTYDKLSAECMNHRRTSANVSSSAFIIITFVKLIKNIHNQVLTKKFDHNNNAFKFGF